MTISWDVDDKKIMDYLFWLKKSSIDVLNLSLDLFSQPLYPGSVGDLVACL